MASAEGVTRAEIVVRSTASGTSKQIPAALGCHFGSAPELETHLATGGTVADFLVDTDVTFSQRDVSLSLAMLPAR